MKIVDGMCSAYGTLLHPAFQRGKGGKGSDISCLTVLRDGRMKEEG